MFPALRAATSCRCQLPGNAFWCEHRESETRVGLSFGLTLNGWRGTNAVFRHWCVPWGFWGECRFELNRRMRADGANGLVWGPCCNNLFLCCAITLN